jgi:hypothetical protein
MYTFRVRARDLSFIAEITISEKLICEICMSTLRFLAAVWDFQLGPLPPRRQLRESEDSSQGCHIGIKAATLRNARRIDPTVFDQLGLVLLGVDSNGRVFMGVFTGVGEDGWVSVKKDSWRPVWTCESCGKIATDQTEAGQMLPCRNCGHENESFGPHLWRGKCADMAYDVVVNDEGMRGRQG